MDFDLDPKMMEDCGLDSKTMEDCGLDPKKTMDFALFQDVCCRFLFPSGSHESMAMLVKRKDSEDIKTLPPLRVILYDDLVKTAWGWDRLLPWMSGYVLFEDYFRYLTQYFLQNADSVSDLRTAASECMAAENKLSTIIGAPGGLTVIADDHSELSVKIKDKANHLINSTTSQPDVTVPAACLMCITEEAKLMSKVLTKWTVEADKASAELLQRKFQFSNEVRKAAFDILTTYRGPYSMQVSASMLGMKKEAGIAFELLQRHDVDHEERLYICEEIRDFTLELLRIIHKCFPQECAIEYCPIDCARAIMGRKHAEHLDKPSKDIVSADKVSPVNTDGTPIPNTRITSTSAVPAAPASWSDQDNTNKKKKKSMGSTRDSDTPSTQASEPGKYSGTADKFGVPTPITALETYGPSTSRESYPEENQKREIHGSDVASLQTCDTSMENADSEKTMEDCGLDPKTMEDCGLDPKMLADCGLDPKKTMDFALFQDVCCRFFFPSGSHESMAMLVKRKDSEDIKTLPPLRVILYDDLVKSAWGWHRLLPWINGYVLFEDYFRYLGQFFLENTNSFSDLRTAAIECMAAENELSRIIGATGRIIGATGGQFAIAGDHYELSVKIKDKATHLLSSTISPANVTVPAACFMCIMEEAKLMSKVLTKWTVEADKASAELLQRKFEFSNEVRKAAFDILKTYRGPYSTQVSASMLGMKREAGIAFELLQTHDVDHEERLYICEEIRDFTLELLRIIHKFFPHECAIEYCPIYAACDIMEKKRTEHLVESSMDIVSADEVSPDMDGTPIPNTPITSKSAVSAASSSWSDLDNTNNEKKKSVGWTQDSDTPSTHSYEPGKYSATADKFGVPTPITVLDTCVPSLRSYAPISIDAFDGDSDLEENDKRVIQASIQTRDTPAENADDEK